MAQKKIEQAQVNKALTILKSLPKKEDAKLSARKIIEMMAPTITECLHKGYTIKEIIPLLKEKGVDLGISEGTFRQYLGKSKAKEPGVKDITPKDGQKPESTKPKEDKDKPVGKGKPFLKMDEEEL